MAQTILGIDIGSYSIKAVKVSRSFREFELLQYCEMELVQNPRASYEENIGATIKSLFEKEEMQADIISISLPAHLLSLRVLELPFGSAKKIDSTIEFELENHIPVAIDEVMIDYHILKTEGERSMVLAAYITKARLVRFVDMLDTFGIEARFVGIDNIDLAHVAMVAVVPSVGVYVLVDIGHSKTNICVMEGQKLLYARSVSLGGIHFTKAIQKAFKLNQDKAEGLKLDRVHINLEADKIDQMSRLCQNVAYDLTAAIRQTELGFKQLYPEYEWSSIMLTGGGSRLSGLTDFMAAALHYNVVQLECLELIPHSLDRTDGIKDVMASALGQTLKVIHSGRSIKINFRQGEFASKKELQVLSGEIKQLMMWFGLVIVLGLFYFFYSYHTLNARLDKAESNLIAAAGKAIPDLKDKKIKSAKKMQDLIASKNAEMRNQLDSLKSGSGGMTALALLKEVSEKMPAKDAVTIDVDSFSYTGDFLRMEGRTNSFEAVDKIKAALGESKLLKKVEAQNVSKGIRDEIKFSLSIELPGKSEEQ